LLVPGAPPVCIEAKLESGEGYYPAGPLEKAIFDERFGKSQGRVHQLELQRFMFATLLGQPCQPLLIDAGLGTAYGGVPRLSWKEAFDALEPGTSIRFVGE